MKSKHYILPLIVAIFALASSLSVSAQPSKKLLTLTVTPANAIAKNGVSSVADAYHLKIGEAAKFIVRLQSSGVAVSAEEVTFSINPDKMENTLTGKVKLSNGEAIINGGTMKTSGFLRCSVKTVIDGETYSASCAVGFEPEKLQPTVAMPSDFKSWWKSQLDEAAKIPMNATLKPLPERSTEKVNVYEVAIDAVSRGNKVYGILCIPKAEGKYPALMRVPGAGVHAIGGCISEAEKGFITLDLGIHGIPVSHTSDIYLALSRGQLSSYHTIGIDSKESYYYRRVFLSCVRAADYLTSLPQHDGKNLFVVGGSQGGALSIVTAALCDKVTAIMTFFPALCDQEAYLHNRAGGWPHYFYFNKNAKNIDSVAKTIAYYDVANFARILSKPVFYSFGYNDITCPPTSTYCTWNVIPSENKKLFIVPETGHWRYPEQWNTGWNWIMQFKQ